MLRLPQRPSYTPRDIKYSHRTPNWYIKLSKPPPLIREDFRPLIEHIRTKGRIDDVSLFGNDDMFDRPIYESDTPPPLDRNAPERLEAEKRFEARRAAREAYLEWANSPAQKRKRLEIRLKREADRAAMQAEREKQQLEYEQLEAKRSAEQQRRDTEWNSAAAVQQRLANVREQQIADQKKRDAWEQHLRLQAIFKPVIKKHWFTPQLLEITTSRNWSKPVLHEISIWWSSGRLLFLEPNWQPLEPDWYRVSGEPMFTVRNGAGLIASQPYSAPQHEVALAPLLLASEWPE